VARRALSASLVLSPFAVALAMQGCTQDFSTFDPTGGGGTDAPTSTTGEPSSTTTSGPTTTTTGGGEGGATTSGPGGGAGGPPTECTTPSDCDDGELCTTDECVGGTCSNTPLEDGTVEPDYVDDPLDCQIRLCEGGVGVDASDDDDDPQDEACRAVDCQGGAPTPGDPINEGETCGSNPLECQDGVCTGCANDGQCPDPIEECLVAECNGDGTCGSTPTDADPLDDDPDDCRMPTCDGSGAEPIFVADASDTPPDGICGVGACNGMTPTQDPAAAGTACASGGAVCDGSVSGATACVVCTVDGGTTYGCGGPTPVCDTTANGGEGVCVGCLIDGDCGADEVCDTATDTCVGCVDDGDCDAGEVCDAATDTCVGCVDDGDCDGGICDTTSNTCVECLDDGDCPGQVCDPDTNQCEDCYSDGAAGTDPGCESDDGLDPVCNEGNRTCGGCTVDADCADNERGTDCRSGGQCGCQNNNNCLHDEAAGPTCSSNVCN
jgi:Cys-rich repeat protein